MGNKRKQAMQMSFSELEYAAKKKQTRRDRFLAEIELVTLWAKLVSIITPHYPKGQGRGRPPVSVERIYIAQQCCGLSDEGIEDALYDSQGIQHFVGINLNQEKEQLERAKASIRAKVENCPRNCTKMSSFYKPQISRRIMGLFSASQEQSDSKRRGEPFVSASSGCL